MPSCPLYLTLSVSTRLSFDDPLDLPLLFSPFLFLLYVLNKMFSVLAAYSRKALFSSARLSAYPTTYSFTNKSISSSYSSTTANGMPFCASVLFAFSHRYLSFANLIALPLPLVHCPLSCTLLLCHLEEEDEDQDPLFPVLLASHCSAASAATT